MPSWEYRCPRSGVVQTFTFASVAERDRTTVVCGGEDGCDPCVQPMERQPSAPNIAFKGAGWTPKHYGGK